MRRSAIFLEAFLDGFTMAGFLGRLRMPGAPAVLFEPEIDSRGATWPSLTFEPTPAKPAGVDIEGDLRAIPDDALHVMIDLLKREDDARKTPGPRVGQADYASSR